MEQVQAVIAAELNFLCVFIVHYPSKPMTYPCLLAPFKIPAVKAHRKRLAVQLGRTICIHRGPAFGTRGDEQAVSCTNYSHR